MHVLDIAQNSVKANAKTVSIAFEISESGWLTIVFTDDGDGIPPELLARITDPFTTTRTTRKVGLGVPLLAENAEMTGGSVRVQSTLGAGTTLTVMFNLRHIDCPPMGDMCETLMTLVALNPEKPEFAFTARAPGREADFDTRAVRQALGDVPLNEPDVIEWIRSAIEEEFKPILEVQ